MKISMFKVFLFLFFLISLFFPNLSFAQTPLKEELLEAVVTAIKEQSRIIEVDKNEHLYQKLELLGTSGKLKGKKFLVENGKTAQINVLEYKIGDKLVIAIAKDINNKDNYYITDFVRRDSLYLLFAIFVGLTLFVGRGKGLGSLIGMFVSFLAIFLFILPQILSGHDPILIAILASTVIIPVNFYIAHGFNKKTTSAILGTIISLIVTGILANFFVEASKLSGFTTDEAAFLDIARNGAINMKGLLLASIIIGALGILDDITISQAAIAHQLKKSIPNISFKELYFKTMNIGRDHIASVVNTLILVYTGAALPLLLLFINNPFAFNDVINTQVIAEEIVRTLVASIGLILAVPITTLITAIILEKDLKKLISKI